MTFFGSQFSVGKEGRKKKQDRINMIDMMKGGGASANPVNHVHPV
jgi:hypothetical protein